MIKGQTDLFVRKATLMKSASLFRLDDHERYGDQQSVFFFFRWELRPYSRCG